MATVAKTGSEILVNTSIDRDQFDQKVTTLADGAFVVTWVDRSFSGEVGSFTSAVKAQVFTADGDRSGPEILVNTATPSDQVEPQITALANGGFVVTWADLSLGVGGATGDSSGNAVKAQVFAADGTRVGSEILVNTATAS